MKDEEKRVIKARREQQKNPTKLVTRTCCGAHKGGAPYTWNEPRGTNGSCPAEHLGNDR